MAGFYSCHIILERLSKIAHSAVFVRGGIKYTAPLTSKRHCEQFSFKRNFSLYIVKGNYKKCMIL